MGAHVATTVSSQGKAIFCKDLKAEAINYKEQDFFSCLKDRGLDVVLIGGEYFEKNLKFLKE